MGGDPSSEWKERTAQQLVCYEALFELLDQIQPLEEISAICGLVAKEWKYFANVACWRLVIPNDEAFLVIDGYRGEAHIVDSATLSPWDSYHFASRLPRLIQFGKPEEGPKAPEHLSGTGISEIQVLPIIRMDRCIGVLSVAARHAPFSELDFKFIRIFGNHFADRIFDLSLRKRSMAVLIDRATQDNLTGLLNRGTILERLSMLMQLSSRTGDPLSVVLADVDKFKTINDSYGHLTGDEVLRELSLRMKAQTRQADQLGRFGGEEFLFVLYPCGSENVLLAAERFRQAIAEKPVSITGGKELTVTISLGCSTFRDGDIRMEDILRRADQALYRSKASGRNRVCFD